MDDKLFTICIPTYNRARKLDVALAAILKQVVCRSRKCISVYVSDNCSEDETSVVLAKYRKCYPDILKVKRQESNIGFERNFWDSVISSESKYVAILGDDDVVMPGYVDEVLFVLEQYHDVAYLNVNMLRYDDGCYVGVRDPFCCYGLGKYYEKAGEFVKEHTHCPSQVSSNVFRKDLFVKAYESNKSDAYPGYAWFAALLIGILDYPCFYIDRPLIVSNSSSSLSWEKYAPLYYIVGLGRIFSDLDRRYEGIYAAWRQVFYGPFFYRYCLDTMLKYRSYYKSIWPDIESCCVTSDYARIAREYVFLNRKIFRFKDITRRVVKSVQNLFKR